MKAAGEANRGTFFCTSSAAILATLLLVLSGWSGISAPPGAYRPPLAAIGNPNPILLAQFGYSLAGVGNDRILIGVPQDNFYEGAGGGIGGSAYLFGTNGTLVAIYTNPTQKLGGLFGYSVAGLGFGRVLVGARLATVGATNAGAVYLFNTNGTLLTTLTNPPGKQNDHFGDAVASVGTDRILVGAGFGGTNNGGVAYLLATNGTVLATFNNPEPNFLDNFGGAVSGVGNDLVVVGAFGNDTGGRDSGTAYIFDTTGALLVSITNPAPTVAGTFGWAVAGMGSDRILVSAEQNYAGAIRAGAAYLFATNGALLTTFTNPAPANGTGFGHALAVVGGDKVLIGAYLDGNGVGVAYLFDTNGTRLAIFGNPTPEVGSGPPPGGIPPTSDRFGFAMAALGPDFFVVGADGDNSGAPGAGSVYIYAEPRPPPLVISAGATNVSVRWAGPEPSFILQESGLLGSPAAWNDVQEPVSSNGPTNLFQQPLGPTNRFYRLRWP